MAITSAPHQDRPTPRRTRLPLAALIILVLLAAIGVVLLARDLQGSSSSSELRGSGIAATSARALADFRGIDLAGSNNVTVTAGSGQSVVVHADSNLLSHVTTQVKAGKLIIRDVGSFAAKSPTYVEVSVPSPTALELSGLAARYVDAVISGSGTIFVTATQRLDAKVPGSGAVLYGGNPPQVTTSITGSGAVTPG